MNEQGALWLYGSYARGDSDSDSDIDLLLVTSSKLIDEQLGAVEALRRAGIDLSVISRSHAWENQLSKISVSKYGWNEIDEMANYGSLFLHHLKLEGKSLWEDQNVKGKLAKKLDHLPAYERVITDFEAFRTAVGDVRESLSEGGSIAFEIIVLATVLRHSAILGCYLAGTPDFGRTSPIEQITKRLSLDPKVSSSLMRLSSYRAFLEGRRSDTMEITESEPVRWCHQVEELISALNERFGHVFR